MIFARFMVIYGHKFKSTFETSNELSIAKREWAISLRDYDEDVLVAAVEKAKETYSWMPSIAEFLRLIELCQPNFGLPSAEEAYAEACRHAEHPSRHRWSHAAVYHVGRYIGWFVIRGDEKTKVWPLFSQYYQGLCTRVLSGEQLPLPSPGQLPEPQPAPLFQLIEQWAKQHAVTAEQAQTMLYYLHLPLRNPTRERLRQKYQHQQPDLNLPRTLDELVLVVGN